MAKDFAEIERMEAEAGLQATDGELTSEAKQSLTSRFVAQWEKKNARRAIRGGVVSTMALTLAACGDGDDNTDQADVDDDNEINVTPIASDLTANSDNVDAGGGDDTITAGLVQNPGGTDRVNSLQDEDVIDGGSGADTLDVTLGNANDNGDTTITPTITNVETLQVAFTGSGTDAVNELDLQNSTGFDALEISGVSLSPDGNGNPITTTVDNVQDVLSTISISDSGEDEDNITVSFDDDVLDGAADVLGLTVDDVDVNNLEIDGEDGEGYETINVTASGDLEADDLQVDEAVTLDFAGAGDVTISGMTLSAGHLSTFDASDATGDYDVDLGTNDIIEAQNSDGSGTDIDFAYTGSAGVDTIRVDEDSLSSAPTAGDDDDGHDSIDGGAGADTLDFTVGADVVDLVDDGVTVSNIETVRLDVTGAFTAELDASLIGGLETVIVRNDSNTDGEVADFDVREMAAGVTVQVEHSTDNDNDDVGDTDVYLHQADGTGSDDTQTVEIVSTDENTSEEFDFTLEVQANDADDADPNDAAVENLTIVDSDTEDNEVELTSFAEHDETLTLSGGRADDTFTIAGDTDDDGNVEASLVATTVAATAQASNVTLFLGSADQDVNMGSGDDTLNFAADELTDDDDVSGGAGTDTIATGFSANDSDSDLNISGVERINLDADANVTVDVSESDEITTVGIVSDDEAVTGGGNGNVITLIADAIATIDYVDTSDAEDNPVNYNGLTISEEDNTSPAAVTVNVADADNQAATVGVLTLDGSTTELTVNNEDDNDVAQTTFNGIAASGLTTLTVTDGFNTVGNAAEETVIDLDNTTALTSLDATGALGGVDVTLEALADSASIDLRNPDDVAADANDALSIIFNGDAGADDVTINGGAGEETIVIENGRMDDLTVTAGAGNDDVDLVGLTGSDIEIDLGAGDDTVEGSDDADRIDGGDGTDTLDYSNAVHDDGTDLDATDTGINLTLDGSTAATVNDGDADVGEDVVFNIENVIGTDAADTITGDTNANVITGGAGDDTLDGGGGADTFNYVDSNGEDTINGFATTTDLLSFDGITDITATTGTAVAADANAQNVSDGSVYVFADGNDGTDDEDIDAYTGAGTEADVASFLAAAFDDEAAGDDFVAVINDVAGNATHAYLVDFNDGNGGNGALDADAITLMGTINEANDAALVAGDIT